jgi:hypothetical protein
MTYAPFLIFDTPPCFSQVSFLIHLNTDAACTSAPWLRSLARLPINTEVRILLMAVKCWDQVSKCDQVHPIGFTDAYGKTNTLLLDALRSLTVSNCQKYTAERCLTRHQQDGTRHWADKRQHKTSPHMHA